MLLPLLLILSAGPASAGQTLEPQPLSCPAATSVADLERAINQGNFAFLKMDTAGLSEAREGVVHALACLGEALNPETVLDLHIHDALASFAAQDRDGALLSFRAALEVNPSFTLPEAVASPRHPLRQIFEQATILAASPVRSIPAPSRGSLLVDGRPATAVPTERPYVFQWLDDDASVLLNARVEAGSGPPVYTTGSPLPLASEPTRATTKTRTASYRVPFLVLAGGGALVGAGVYGHASRKAEAFNAREIPCGALADTRSDVNALVVGAIALETLSVLAVAAALAP
jgi:hypothetical protein